MATIPHCIFCFESLASHFEIRKSMTLEGVEEAWEKYSKDADAIAKKQLPALRRTAAASSTSANSSISTPSSGSTVSLANSTPATSTTSLPGEDLVTEYPLFVTWNTISRSSGRKSLRGCIGTFEAQELDAGLSSYALTSAFDDTRFDSISKAEMPSLEVCVTLLTDFEDCEDAMDWELGTHGIRISFIHSGRRYGATYLPDVAPEQGWTKEETLACLMRKAGWIGTKDKWQDSAVKVVRYQGKKESLQYAEYKRWCDWVDANMGE